MAQLIDASSQRTIWSEQYDRPIGEFFDLQDQVTTAITGVVAPALNLAERSRLQHRPRPSLDAWEACQKGLDHYYRPFTTEDHATARQYFDQSVGLDPNFADAHAMIGLMGAYAASSGQSSYSASKEGILAEAEAAAARAVALDDGNALAHMALGRVALNLGRMDLARAECETAVSMNPNFALAHFEHGFVCVHTGDLDRALLEMDTAIRLGPNDPSRLNFYLLKGHACIGLGRFEAAADCLDEATRLRPAAFWTWQTLAWLRVEQKDLQGARAAIAETLARNPDWTLARMRTVLNFTDAPNILRWIECAKIAGLPEA